MKKKKKHEKNEIKNLNNSREYVVCLFMTLSSCKQQRDDDDE
jgi:hypothetical protein